MVKIILKTEKISVKVYFGFKGSYFVCNDGRLKPQINSCVLLSFGSARQVQFDEYINKELGCIVHSFDPFIEPFNVEGIRSSKSNFKDSITVPINDKWFFHSLGISDHQENPNKKKWLDTYPNILNYLNLNGKTIDIIKMDVEMAEYPSLTFIMNTNPDLLCKYVKQIAIEIHPGLDHSFDYKAIHRLDLCFRLYKRDQRFFFNTNPMTEWQMPTFQIDLKRFKNEVELAQWLFIYGELYFVNINFL